MRTLFILLFAIVLFSLPSLAQENYKDITAEEDLRIYPGADPYAVKTYPQKFKSKRPKNVILMIGDGMGVAQVFTGITANGGRLFLDNFKNIGFSKTQSASKYVTDSAAGGTALSTGVKTYNGGLSVDTDTIPVKTILEDAEEEGLATGLVSTSSITHATPASFIAHQKSRSMYEEIAADFLKTEIDVFIGGGYKHFTERKDGRNLTDELKNKGYKVLQDKEKIAKVKTGKLAGLTSYEHNGRLDERGDILPVATETAINILQNNKDGFFLMVEGSQIDWACHQNNTVYIVEEVFDFDKAIGKALDFASKDGKTLIIVTADHETGGLTTTGGDSETGKVIGAFGTKSHSGVMVPVFAYGPGAENFTGIMDNTDINHKIKKLLLKK